MIPTTEELQRFYDALESHDWYYEFSDDHRVYTKGLKRTGQLREAAKASSDHKKLFEAFHAWAFSGRAFGTPQQPKPRRPE